MAKAIACGVLAIALCYPCAANAAAIVLGPNSPLSALAGETIGWGYDISADDDWNLEFLSSFVDLPADSGQLVDLFDFPIVPAGTSVRLDYDPSGPSGLVELMLSPLLLPGDTVIGRIFLEYLLIDPLGARPEETGVFELQVSAVVSSPTPCTRTNVPLAARLGHRRACREASSRETLLR